MVDYMSRPPRGGRGLKLQGDAPAVEAVASPPSRGAWIEIPRLVSRAAIKSSPPSRGAWIEINSWPYIIIGLLGRPPRGGRGLKFYQVDMPD